MAPAFTTCLFFSCFFLERWSLVSLQRLFPKPTLRITSASVTVRGGILTLSCAAAAQDRDVRFALYRGGDSFPPQDPPRTEAVFHFTNVNSGHEGRYYCRYYSKGANRIESEPSDAVEVKLEDFYPKPSVVLSPGSLVARGGTLTINCTSEYPNMRFALYRDGTSRHQLDPPGSQAVFVISGVQQTDEGRYECRYHPRYGAVVWSAASDPFQIRVLDLPKPLISYEPVRNVEGEYKITCSAPQEKKVKRYFLFKDKENGSKTDRTPSPGSQSVTFPISGVNARAGTEYRCSYQIQESGEFVESPHSDPIQIGKDNQLETSTATTPRKKQQETSTATTPRNEGQMPSVETTKSSDMGTTLTIAVVCAVLLVVILVVAFILYIKCKPKKAKGDIQKRNLPLNEEQKTDSLEPMYAIVTKVKTSNNTIAPEVKKQEEGGYDEGVTYAIINRDALKNQKKNAAPPFQHPEPTLYASVNIP